MPLASPNTQAARESMKTGIALLALCLTQNSFAAENRVPSAQDFRRDFAQAVQLIADNYAYFDKKQTAWSTTTERYANDVARITTRAHLVVVLEQVLDELYDPHAQLNTNSPKSWRLVPSGTDLWAEWRGGNATITEVRTDSDASRAGVRTGDIVVAVNAAPIAAAVEARMGRTYPHSAPQARDWALRSVLAGRHDSERALVLKSGVRERTVKLPARDQFSARAAGLVSHTIKGDNVGYIRINDSLGDGATIQAFDVAVDALMNTRALIVDLRNTASGGNSSVARGMIGRFVRTQLPYQRHELPAEEHETGVKRSWLELVSPRGAPYTKPVAVLVDHWTGSMGEGIAIGFDATRAAVVIGTPMAGLIGATYHLELSNSGIGMNVPAERLYHVDGTAREDFVPRVLVDPTRASSDQDPFVEEAMRVLK
jgi:C-terminal processing protease CtpA/Prc